MRRRSLHRRLLWLVGLPVIALWLAAGAWLAERTAHETAEMFDRELQRTAASVLAVVASAPAGAAALAEDTHRQQADDERPEIVVRDRTGRLLLDASTLPAAAAGAGDPTFRTLRHEGESWRVYQRWDASRRYWIQVAAPLHDREELLSAHVRALLIPIAALVLLLPLAIWIGLRSGLAPVRKVSRAIGRLPAQTPTLTREDVPAELLQLTRALDTLVANLGAALSRERRFTADAAHELRHPLAVLRMELDLAGVAGEDTVRQAHLQRAREGLRRMERLVAQLLTLARVESLDELPDSQPLAVSDLARHVVAEAGERAAPRGIGLSLQADSAVRVQGSAGLLEVALRNLIDNAIAHGKSHGKVEVTVARQDAIVELAVADDGPGIPQEQAMRAGERFLRGRESGGSGLGPSIVQAIAALPGGSVRLSRSIAGGALAVLCLPAVMPASGGAASRRES